MEVYITIPRSKEIDSALNKNEIYENWKVSIHKFFDEESLNEYLNSAKNDDYFKALGRESYFMVMKGTTESLNDRIDYKPYKVVDINW